MQKNRKNVHFDFKGMIFLSGWLIALQVVLDKGNDADWFELRGFAGSVQYQ